MQHSTGALVRPETTPTEPLSPVALAAMRRLELALLPVSLDVVRAVTRYETAAHRYDELAARPASTLSPVEFDAIGEAQQTMADAFSVLAETGRTNLLAPLETATQYRTAAAHCRSLSAAKDFDGCLAAQDEMAMCRCRLAAVGRLDLIEVDR